MGEGAQVGSWLAVRGKQRTALRAMVGVAVLMAVGAVVMLFVGRSPLILLLWVSQAALLASWGGSSLVAGTAVG